MGKSKKFAGQRRSKLSSKSVTKKIVAPVTTRSATTSPREQSAKWQAIAAILWIIATLFGVTPPPITVKLPPVVRLL